MPASSARSVFVWVNPRAGTHAAGDIADRIRTLFRDRQINAQVVAFDLRSGASTPFVAGPVRRTIPKGSTIVAAGGDGTVSAVAALALETSSTFGVLPLGTLNHFARDLGLPIDLDKAADLIAASNTSAIDVGFINDRLFVNNCSLGVYPTIVEAREQLRRRGHRKWSAMLLATARVLPRHHRLIVKLDADGEPTQWRTPFVLISNNAYETTGLDFGARKSIQSGHLYAYVAPAIRARQLPLAAAKAIVTGALRRRRSAGSRFEVVEACQLWIDATGPRRVTIAIDGELSFISLPAHFRIAPRTLRVIVPPADGGSR